MCVMPRDKDIIMSSCKMYFYDNVYRLCDEKHDKNENEKTMELGAGKNKKFVVQKFGFFTKLLI